MKKRRCVKNKPNGKCVGFKLEDVINWNGCFYYKKGNGDVVWNQQVHANILQFPTMVLVNAHT
jgi:hypothetical protein